MLSIFKKKATAQPTPAPKPVRTDWATWKEFFKKDSAEVFEPETIAVQRLNGKAKDVGATQALAMYNSHKTKLQNQWINPLQSVNSGFGNAQLSFYNYQTVNYWQCMQLAQDPLFAKVFNVLSSAPYSKGGQITLPEGSQIDEDALEQAVKQYRLWDEIRSGTRSSYVCGGCLLYMDFGLTTNELAEPLDLKKINCHKFKRFKHIDPINVAAIEVNTVDPTAADYMKPTKWYVIGLGVVHHSHFIQFEANPPELPMRPLTMYFGMPLTQLIKQDVANSNLVSQGMANLINRSRYIYLKSDPADFATDNASQFRDRLEYMSYVQDNFGVMPLKNTEDVLQLTTSLTGFAENVEQAYLLISAKTDIPYTELMGKSAAGMNATGEGDRRKWYDKCRSIQEDNKPAILKMYGIVAAKIGDGHFVDFPDYVFDPLEEATEKELAENIKAYTDVATALVGLGANPDSVIEWLKQFKQFNLDSVDFDTSTPGLEDYTDGDDDPDNNPGGGLPGLHEDLNIGDGVKAREDITPKVLAALKAMNAKKDASGHLHDESTGQFTSGGDSGFNKPGDDGASGKSKIRVTVKPIADITAERKKMFKWYQDHLQGHTVEHSVLGKILFSRKGGTHSMHNASSEKIALIPHLKEIISSGTTKGWEPLKHNRQDGFAEFAIVQNNVSINGKDTSVGCFIAKDVNGKIYYDLYINKTAASYIPEDIVRANNGFDTHNIDQEKQIVNLFILSKD